jgi:hypothetical protein
MKSAIKVDIEVVNDKKFCSSECPQKASTHSCKLYGELDMYIVSYLRDKRCIKNEINL